MQRGTNQSWRPAAELQRRNYSGDDAADIHHIMVICG